MTRHRLIIASLAALGCLAAPAVAGDGLRFGYRAEELWSDVGRRGVIERARSAAKEYCMMESRRSLKAFETERSCVADVAGQIVDRIGDADLASTYRAQTALNR